MKTRQEQIEEMAPYMCHVCELNDGLHDCIHLGDKLCGLVYEATNRIYSAGYRKASDVIDEFVERLKQVLNKHEHRSQKDGVPFYQMNAESFCDELNAIVTEMLQEVEK